VIRAGIADRTLRPGSPAPSGAALARATGFNVVTCRKALDLLIMDGTLRAGPSPNARARVAGGDQAWSDPAARAAALVGAPSRLDNRCTVESGGSGRPWIRGQSFRLTGCTRR